MEGKPTKGGNMAGLSRVVRAPIVAAFPVLVFILSAPAPAQTDPNVTMSTEIVAGKPGTNFGAFGSQNQDLWISASEFTGKLDTGQADLTYDQFYFYSNQGSGTPQRYFAEIPLPSGAQISLVECRVTDSSAANDVFISLQRSPFDVNTNSGISTEFVASDSTTGATGIQVVSLPVDETILHTDQNIRNLYAVTADIASDTELRECRIVWRRTVSPAPAVATFNDVPTNHPFFRFVEALAAAGITGGCGSGIYCPDNPVTRGQMAVFLSVALGLHFPQ
jgi:hypothetical protein